MSGVVGLKAYERRMCGQAGTRVHLKALPCSGWVRGACFDGQLLARRAIGAAASSACADPFPLETRGQPIAMLGAVGTAAAAAAVAAPIVTPIAAPTEQWRPRRQHPHPQQLVFHLV